MPRRTKLTPELQAKLCNALKAGNFIEPVCAAYGIDQSTFHRWLTAGIDHEVDGVLVKAREPYRTFRKAVEEAQAQPEVVLVNKTYREAMGQAVTCANVVVCKTCGTKNPCGNEIQGATEGDARAREFLLSRKFGERWGAKDRVEHSGPGGGPIQAQHKVLRFGGRYRQDGSVKLPSDPALGAGAQSTEDAKA